MGRKFEVIEGRRDTAAPSPDVRREAYGLYRAGRTAAQVARFMNIEFNLASDLIFEHQQWMIAQAEQRGYITGRRSLLTPPPATAARRAA